MTLKFSYPQAEGQASHPDFFDNVDELSDERYLRQLQAFADWIGVEETKTYYCSRPSLLRDLK